MTLDARRFSSSASLSLQVCEREEGMVTGICWWDQHLGSFFQDVTRGVISLNSSSSVMLKPR